MMDMESFDSERRAALSIAVFADGSPTFIWGEWLAWRSACDKEGRIIPPAEFKSLKRGVGR